MTKGSFTPVDSGIIPREEGHLFYSVSGQGTQNVLWIHGLPLQSESWLPQLQYFDKDCRNIVFDLRGYGRSSKLPKPCDNVTDLYLADILAVLDHLQLNQPVIVGFASAGHGVLRFAAQHPDKLSQLIVINGSPCFMKREDWNGAFDEVILHECIRQIDAANSLEDIWAILSQSALNEACGQHLDQLKAWYGSMAAQAGKETIKAFFNHIAYDDDRSLMANISVPTLIISSTMDHEVPSDTALFLRKTIPNAQLCEINDIGHFVFATQSGLVNHVIKQFIQPSCDIVLPKDGGAVGE
ncbi:alpha/beta fold hydrolase [Legionella jamestowniensis]|uniref:Biotin biosynthesis protein BioH n=1 Tax=Legionella jamestowniensis TaxID=455 RepID=A0A0W0UGL5_9GAMM|nr:alpha/beta hydrolase [Legionella jamestowniensis]KTD06984.1 biotin biosynthesis protein BioH [Legionella jamestowniensis]OCH96784.1 hypothetical protein A8135_06405 [Legionella jamestowniensis]SFM04210.1 Pimeloyl-ACP methyl ester carboxylesterase [Legionella jamestowniensis DSM 19215]